MDKQHRACPSVKFHLQTTERILIKISTTKTTRITSRGISGSHTGADEDSSLLEHDTVLTGNVLFLNYSDPEDGYSKLFQNIGNYLPVNTASSHKTQILELQGGSNMTRTNCDLFTHK
jgi:hypothetical protein